MSSRDGQRANRAPTVASVLAGAFTDPDADALTITAASSDEALVTVAADSSALTLTAVAGGTATITVSAQDPDGERVSDAFDATVDPAPQPETPKTELSGTPAATTPTRRARSTSPSTARRS